MELRTLKYFLAVAQEGNISNAAKLLHVSQPTLSRQLAALEKEFGRELYTRGRDGIELTEHGVILQHYANSIVSLSDKAESEMAMPAKSVKGTVHIGAGDTRVMSLVAQAMRRVRAEYPDIDFEIHSGTTYMLKEDLVRGFCDVLVECELLSHAKMNTMQLPQTDSWGVLMRADCPLAEKESINAGDLVGMPLIMSYQGTRVGELGGWLEDVTDRLDVAASFHLPLNCKYLVSEGVGVALIYDGLIDCPEGGDLVFRPLDPPVEAVQGVVWRKSMPNKQTQVFLDTLRQVCEEYVREHEIEG